MRRRLTGLLIAATTVLGACRGDALDERLERRLRGSTESRAPTSETFRDAVRAVLPAVVYIQVEAQAEPQVYVHPLLGFRQVPPQDMPPAMGSGSGVIFSEDGHILTANHVVQEADRVLVVMHDGRQFEARVVARDPSTDIAVVRIEAENLPVAELGESASLELGDWVLAVGSPLGLRFTVTAGVISAKERAIGILEQNAAPDQAAPLESFLQTDAPINPGNSGGPLVDLSGRVIGINTAILNPAQTGTWAGYGFAVPIDLARRVALDLIRYGEVRRAYLGVLLQDLTPADVKVYGLENAEGAEVAMVAPDGPAGRAGLRLGDVIVSINDEERVASRAQLMSELAELDPGTTARLGVIRKGERMEVPVQLGTVTSGVRPAAPREPSGPAKLGFAVAEARDGVVVADVRPYSPASRAGIRQGMRIHSVNGRNVSNIRDFAQAVERLQNVVSLVVGAPGSPQFIVNYEVR